MDFEEFKRLVVGLFARYPSATMSDATVPAWWADLRGYSREALIEAFRRAPRGSPQFCPSCELVREHAEAVTKSLNTPRPDYSRPALPEPSPELDADTRAALEEVKYRLHTGQIKPDDLGLSMVRAIQSRLE